MVDLGWRLIAEITVFAKGYLFSLHGKVLPYHYNCTVLTLVTTITGVTSITLALDAASWLRDALAVVTTYAR